jgi:hypothetical protein
MNDVVRKMIAAETAKLAREVRTPTGELGYGVDLKCREDLSPRLDEIDPNGLEGIGQDLFHRITTDRNTGALAIDAPDYGINVARFLSMPTDQAALASYAGRVAAECRKDDRVDRVEVTVTMRDSKNMRITIIVDPLDPELTTFTLIVAITSGAVLLEAILQ